jgi:hypothetical protein
MNEPKAIEAAVASVIREYAVIGASTHVRTWQSIRHDGSWDAETDREFPLVDIRVTPPIVEDGQCNLIAECAVRCATKTDDDADHAAVSELYAEVKAAVDRMFGQFRRRTDGPELARLKADMSLALGADFEFSGLTWGAGIAPYNDGGLSVIGFHIQVRYIRKDFV